MKKIYLIATFLGASLLAYSQALKEVKPIKTVPATGKPISTNNGALKALGTSIWSSDFSNATDWTIGGNGNQGAWIRGFTSSLPNSPQYYSAIQSTTVTNGIAYFAGIQYLLNGTVTSQNAWIEMTNNLDCSAHSVVSLEFEQAYRAFNSDNTLVEVSLDGGTTWQQTVDINPTVVSNTYATELVVIRNFTVNNSATVKFRFRWENTSTAVSGSGYAWQIDDVSVKTLADHDIAITNYLYGTNYIAGLMHYHQIPLSQAAAIESSAVLSNRGSQDQTNVVFSATESVNGLYTGTSTPIGMLNNTSDSVVVSNFFTPTTNGNYKLDYSISYNNVDDYPLNNTVDSYKFSVGDAIFARDSSTQATNGIVYGQATGSTRVPSEAMEAGNAFVMTNNARLTAVDFQFGNVVAPGQTVTAKLYDVNLVEIPNTESDPYTMAIGDEGEYKTLTFSNPPSLQAGISYIVILKSAATNFSLATAGKSAPQTSFIYYATVATWYYTTNTPVVRMNFAPAAATSTASISGFSHLIGTPSQADSFNVEGFNLTSDMTVTAPTNFEISNSLAGPYSTTLNLTNINGAVSSTKLYVRLNGPLVNYNQMGDIVISSTGAADRLIALQGQTYDSGNTPIGSVTTTNNDGVGIAVGNYVSIEGVLHCNNFRTTGYDLTMIDDNNDGINIFSPTMVNGYVPTEGDKIKVEGQIEQYNGLIQIIPTTITVLSQGATLQSATLTATLDETTESQFIELQGLNLINGETTWPSNGNVDVTNGVETFRVRIPAASPLAGTATPGGTFYLTGIGKQFDSSLPFTSGYQIFPCSAGPFCDIDLTTTTNFATITANQSGLSYQWIDCADSSEIAGETNISYTATENGNYAVIIFDGACIDTSDCVLIDVLGLSDNDFSGVSVYPNPVNNVLKISQLNDVLESVELVTTTGRIVYSSEVTTSIHEINVTDISSGVYFVNVRSANSAKTFKVIK